MKKQKATEKKENTNSGYLFIYIYIAISSLSALLVGRLLVGEKLNLFLLLLLSLVPFWLVFLFIELRQQQQQFVKKVFTEIKSVIWINIFTVFTWLFYFLALKLIIAEVDSFISFGVVPIFTLIADKLIRKNVVILRIEKITAVVVSITILILGYFSLRNDIRYEGYEYSIVAILKGGIFSVLGGVGIAGYTIFSKNLYDKNWNISLVFAARFPLLILISLIYVILNPNVFSVITKSHMPYLLAFFFSLAIPIYVYQLGVERLQPLTLSKLLTLTPIATVLLGTMFDETHFPIIYTLLFIPSIILMRKSEKERYFKDISKI